MVYLDANRSGTQEASERAEQEARERAETVVGHLVAAEDLTGEDDGVQDR